VIAMRRREVTVRRPRIRWAGGSEARPTELQLIQRGESKAHHEDAHVVNRLSRGPPDAGTCLPKRKSGDAPTTGVGSHRASARGGDHPQARTGAAVVSNGAARRNSAQASSGVASTSEPGAVRPRNRRDGEQDALLLGQRLSG
jgi:hypothetical protein